MGTARTQFERATAAWAVGDRAQAQSLAHEAYPAIAESWRAHDVSRCWLYFGLIALSIEKLDDADERFGNAERHWREIEKPLHIHRILLQRSWVDIFRGDFDAARRACGRGAGTAGFVATTQLAAVRPTRTTTSAASGGRMRWLTRRTRQRSCERAAELKVPAALAVDSVRHAIADADARMRWATHVSARMLAGAFAVAWEWGNTELVSELVEYHSARGTFSAEPRARDRRLDRHRDRCGAHRNRRRVRPGRRRCVALGRARGADAARSAAATADGPEHRSDTDALPHAGARAVRPRRDRRRRRLGDVAVTDSASATWFCGSPTSGSPPTPACAWSVSRREP